MNTPGPMTAGFFAATGRIVIRLAAVPSDLPVSPLKAPHTDVNATALAFVRSPESDVAFRLVLDPAVVPGRDGQVGSRFGDGD